MFRRWLFIIEGVMTIGLAAVFASFMPNLPTSTRQLSAEEKALAVWRLDQDAGRDEIKTGARTAFM